MADVNVGALLSTTLKLYRDTLVDNIFASNALFFSLKQKGAVKEESGGERIIEPLMYGKNTTAGSYSGYDLLDTTPQAGIDSAEFNWKQYSVSITISGEEERKNAGNKAKIIDLLDAKTEQARMSLVEALDTGIFSDGTGNSSKDITGLRAMVVASGTYGGINGTTYTWWRAYVENAAEAIALDDMRIAYNTTSVGGKDHADLLVTTQDIFQDYEGLFTATITMLSDSSKKLADGGYQTLEFKGQPIVWDEGCPTGYMYFLNLKHMKLVVHKDANFKVSEFVKPENQDAKTANILFMGNLTCNRRKSMGVLTGRT